MLHSAWSHHPTANFHLLDCGIAPETVINLETFAAAAGIRLNAIKVDIASLLDLPTHGRWSAATFARLLIPDLLRDVTDRVLYLDADCIVVGDLTELWQTEMGQAAIAGVHDQKG